MYENIPTNLSQINNLASFQADVKGFFIDSLSNGNIGNRIFMFFYFWNINQYPLRSKEFNPQSFIMEYFEGNNSNLNIVYRVWALISKAQISSEFKELIIDNILSYANTES